MNKAFLFVSTVICLLFCACSKDNTGEVVNPGCVTTNVTYSGTVAGIISNNCLGCHGATPSAPFSLHTYALVKAKVDEGRLFGAINHSPGFSAMPKNGTKLSDCDINKIKAWIDAGAANN